MSEKVEILIEPEIFDYQQLCNEQSMEIDLLKQQNKQMREALRLACISTMHDDTLDVQPIIDMYMEMATYS
jgi:hypothetical protein